MKRTRERASNLLLYGFAASIAAHVLLLPLAGLHAMQVVEPPAPHDVTIDTRLKGPTPSPAPTSTPLPKVLPRVAARVSLRPRAPHQRAVLRSAASAPATTAYLGTTVPGDDGVTADGAGPAGPAADSAAATARAGSEVTPAPLACGRPDVVAATLRALEPELPALAQQQGVSGTVDVVVTLDASSRIVSARIAHSPSVLLDAAALAAARGSVFRTETRGCVPIPAEYLFRVDFVGA